MLRARERARVDVNSWTMELNQSHHFRNTHTHTFIDINILSDPPQSQLVYPQFLSLLDSVLRFSTISTPPGACELGKRDDEFSLDLNSEGG